LGGSFFEPTVLTDVTTDMVITKEETFGPVAPLYRFKSEDDAIKMANDTEFGLASYFYSRDIGRIWRVAEALEYGIVGINKGVISTEIARLAAWPGEIGSDLNRCDRRRRERCALMKATQRVPALRGAQPDGWLRTERRLRSNCVAATPRRKRKSRSPPESGRCRMREPGTGLERESRAKRALRGRKSSEFERPGRESAGSARLRRHLCSNIVVREAEKADHPGVR
jgi:Aldehyde dehydrogenase family